MTVSVTTAYNQQNIKPIFKFQLGASSGIYLFFSAVHHLFMLILIWRKKYYQEWIESGRGYFRWYEYGLSLGVMVLSCAFVSGITDLGYLVVLFITNFAIHWLYAAHDKINFLQHKNHEKVDWHYLILSIVCQFFMWLTIYMNFFGRAGQGLVPLWAIIILLFTTGLYLCNIGNIILQHLYVGPWFYGEFTEIIYMITNFSFKFIVSWMVFGYSCTSFE